MESRLSGGFESMVSSCPFNLLDQDMSLQLPRGNVEDVELVAGRRKCGAPGHKHHNFIYSERPFDK